MDIIRESVRRLEEQIHGSGSEDGIVTIDTDPNTVICQYERGACLRAQYGGRSAEFVTSEPIIATTRISFMFGASLEKLPQRAAACAILNVATGFFCLSRALKACEPEKHKDCLSALKREIGHGRIYPVGMTSNATAPFENVVINPEEADIIVVVGDGLIDPGTGNLIALYTGKKRILFLSPSTAGVSALTGCSHWCPYGRG
ncbi:MAG: hypothetical protein LUO81_04750 [Methanoregulaceae archaeon]|nr:hypothetical protein [Methanoregulaceae archaeon]